jgi:hypothetical protein
LHRQFFSSRKNAWRLCFHSASNSFPPFRVNAQGSATND